MISSSKRNSVYRRPGRRSMWRLLLIVWCITVPVLLTINCSYNDIHIFAVEEKLPVYTYKLNLLPRYTNRQKKLQDVCLTNPPGFGRGILTHDIYKLSYCAVPKAGCTYWINVFRFLYKETGGVKVSSPNEIPRMVTHYAPKIYLRSYNMKTAKKFLPNTFRFLFTRDPYSRLWSAYVDKFLLPDFWCTEARRLAPTKWKPKCHNNVTFEEFLKFVVSTKLDDMNEHWIPVSYMCDPCKFQPNVIGKMETFLPDVKFILSQVGLSHLIGTHGHDIWVEHEIQMLSEYNFQLPCKSCSNEEETAKRLWKTFQINGYLPMDTKLPSEKLKDVNDKLFTDLVIKTFRENPLSRDQVKQQRQHFLSEAFRSVPAETISKLKTLYATDFLMFNYDPNPSWLQANKSNDSNKDNNDFHNKKNNNNNINSNNNHKDNNRKKTNKRSSSSKKNS